MLEGVLNRTAFRLHLMILMMGYLVVVLEYTLLRLCSNAEQISVKLTRFRRIYVNCPRVVLTNHTSYTAFLLDVRCVVQSGYVPFLQLLVPNYSVFAQPIFVVHTCCSNVVTSKVGKQTKRREIVIHKYIKTDSLS